LLEEAIIDAVAKVDKMLADWLAEPVQSNAEPDRRRKVNSNKIGACLVIICAASLPRTIVITSFTKICVHF